MKLWYDEEHNQLHIEPETLADAYQLGMVAESLFIAGIRCTDAGIVITVKP